MPIQRCGCLFLVAVLLLAAAAAAEEPTATTTETTETAAISLDRLSVAGALTMLRTVVDTRGLEPIDDHTVGITDAPEVVALARTVIDLAEHPSDLAGEVTTHTAADGSVIAAVRLQHALLPDVARALRVEVHIKKLAFEDALPTVVVRDTPEQVAAAIALMRRLDQAPQ